MGIRELKKELQKESKADLIRHIAELYKKYKPVKEYFSFYINPDEQALLMEYKGKVKEGFFPSRGYNIKLALARKALNDFKKLGPSEEKVVELELYYVECGVDCTNEYGDMWEAFYDSLVNTFYKAINKASTLGILKKVKKQADYIFNGSQNIGWGFEDGISDTYYEYYDEN